MMALLTLAKVEDLMDQHCQKRSTLFYESPIGHAVRFVEDGRCQLLLEAPGIIRGVGETWTLEADFRDTEYLHDFEGR